MRKRPLCIAAILLLLICWILPKDVWLKMPDIPSGKSLTVTGTVTKREQKENKWVYYLKDCQCDLTDSEFSMLAYIEADRSYPIGCEISLEGILYQLNKADNPGQFDAEEYYQSQGILYTFQTESVHGGSGKAPLREAVTCFREALAEKLSEVYDQRDAGILKAVLLGDKSSLEEEEQLLYQKNGISHLLAISGLHISMIGITIYKLLRKWNLKFWEAGVPSSFLLVLYGMMTGFGISAIRAICMFLVMIFADIVGRTYDMASAMALAAMIILLRNPLQARQAGFLLSFGAVLGICVVYPILQSVFQVRKKVFQTILFSISISMITYPLSVHFFYEYPLHSILLNFIVIPCMPVIMLSGILGLLAGFLMPEAGAVAGIGAHLGLELYEFLGTAVLKWPFLVMRLGCEKLWQLMLYYVILLIGLLLLWYDRRRIYSFLFPAAILTVTLRFHSEIEFTMLDVGQGDGLFLRLPQGTTCFVDGGSSSIKNVGKYRMLPYLKYEGVEKLDYVIFTHLDEDHVNGMRELVEMSGGLDGVEIGMMLFPDIANPDDTYEEIWTLAEEKGIMVQTIGAGDAVREKDAVLRCIYPFRGMYAKDKNNSSVVLELTYKEFSMLLTGDLGFEGEKELLASEQLENIDVWKVSHHGSKYSGSEKFLEQILPDTGLISVGRNYYGHPSREMLERLKILGSKVWTTLESGAIMLESDGKSYSVSLQK